MKLSSCSRRPLPLILAAAAALAAPHLHAADATWLANPVSGDFRTNANWDPADFPNTQADTATFGVSSQTAVTASSIVLVDGVVFSAGASAYSIAANSPAIFQLAATGIVNNSSTTQNFLAKSGSSTNFGQIIFFNNSTISGPVRLISEAASLLNGHGGSIGFTNQASAGSGDFLTEASTVVGSGGGSLQFASTASAGNATIRNQGQSVGGAKVLSGVTTFSGQSTASQSQIANEATSGVIAIGAITRFAENAKAGSATITNFATSLASSFGGATEFQDQSSGENATITNQASGNASSAAAQTNFRDTSTAGAAQINNQGSSVADAGGGFSIFDDNSTAGNATIRNQAATVNEADGGATEIRGSASAGSATILNMTGAKGGGFTSFLETSTAGLANITNQGGTLAGTVSIGITSFKENSTAGSATIFTEGGNGRATIGGNLNFSDASTGGSGTFTVGAGKTDLSFGGLATFENTATLAGGKLIVQAADTESGSGGSAQFLDTASAGSGKLEIHAPSVSGVFRGAGSVSFRNSSTAARAQIDVFGQTGNSQAASVNFQNQSSAAGSQIHLYSGYAAAFFSDSATASTAQITVDARASTLSLPGQFAFSGQSSAADAVISNGGIGQFSGSATAARSQIRNKAYPVNTGFSAAGAYTNFLENATAGQAQIVNEGSAFFAGAASTRFFGNSTAANASITNLGGTAEYGRSGPALFGAGNLFFYDTASAGNAFITTNGGTVAGAPGGRTEFISSSTAGNAVLITNGGPGLGGITQFYFSSTGGSARAITNAGGFFDISPVTSVGLTLGSIEGAGTYQLGGKTLTVGSRNTSTEVAGSIQDGGSINRQLDEPSASTATGGSLVKVGRGTLTLSGVSTYNGATSVSAGKLLVNGTLGNTAVSVANAATLGGSGAIGGKVTVQNGGILSPGNSPGKLTVASLKLNPNSILQYELNVADSPESPANDLVDVTGDLTLDGLLKITSRSPERLVNDNVSFSKGTYRLFNYGGSLINNGLTLVSVPTGFNAGDFVIETSTNGQVNLAPATSTTPGGGSVLGVQYWDGANPIANGRIDGGDGVWTNSDTNWTNQPANLNGPWGKQTAIFAATPGTVLLGEDIAFEKLQFAVDGYRIISDGSNALTASGAANIDTEKGVRAEISAPLLVSGVLTKTGAGTVVLDAGPPSEAAAVQVEQGSVYLNTVLRAKTLTVSSDALLGGGGLQVGDVRNSGTLAPGNSVGVLAIDGNYIQENGGTFALEVGSPENFDRLLVSGRAQIGGTLRGIELGYHFAYGDRFPFLQADTIAGDFQSVELPDANLRGRFIKESGTGILLIAPQSYTQVAVTPNQRSLARALDQFLDSESGDEVTLALDQLRAEQYPGALEALLPSIYEAALSTNLELSQNHGQLLHQQLSARRLGFRQTETETTTAFEKSGKDKVAVEVESLKRWTTWTQGSGLYASDGLSQISGDDFQSGTFLLGADYSWNQHFASGLFASYQNGEGDYLNGANIDLETIRIGLYGTADFGPLYINAAAGVGSTDFSIDRAIRLPNLDRRASSDPDGSEFFAELGTGYDFQWQNWTFGPQVSLQYSRVEVDDFTEHGARSLNLRVNDFDDESLRSYLGARIAYNWKVSPKLAVIPELRAFWQHEYLQDGADLSATLDQGKGGRFGYETPSPQRDSVFVGAGLGVQIGSQVYANLYYNADFGRSNETSHTVTVSASLKF